MFPSLLLRTFFGLPSSSCPRASGGDCISLVLFLSANGDSVTHRPGRRAARRTALRLASRSCPDSELGTGRFGGPGAQDRRWQASRLFARSPLQLSRATLTPAGPLAGPRVGPVYEDLCCRRCKVDLLDLYQQLQNRVITNVSLTMSAVSPDQPRVSPAGAINPRAFLKPID